MLETIGIALFIIGLWGLVPPPLLAGVVQVVLTIALVRMLVQQLAPRPH